MSPLNINHVVEDMQVLSGGVPAVVRQLTRRLVLEGHKATVTYCIGDASDLNDVASTVRYSPNGLLRYWSHSSELETAFSDISPPNNNGCCIHHIHGMWKAPQILAAKAILDDGGAAVSLAAGGAYEVISGGLGQAANAFAGLGTATSEASPVVGALYSASARDVHFRFTPLVNNLAATGTVDVICTFVKTNA